MAKATIDLKEFNEKLDSTFSQLLDEMGDAFQAQLTQEKREYPRTTKRRYGRGVTGKLAGSPRDVVDSKALVNSYGLEKNELTGVFSWNAIHAAIVYTGWVSSIGTKIPPYMWCNNVINEIDWTEVFSDIWNDR